MDSKPAEDCSNLVDKEKEAEDKALDSESQQKSGEEISYRSDLMN